MATKTMRKTEPNTMVGGWCDVAAYIKALARNLRIEGVRARSIDTPAARTSAAGDPTRQRHLELFVPAADVAAARRYLRNIGLARAAKALGA